MAKRPRGPTAVALLALHDRAFFERLVKNPKMALMEVGDRLKLSEDDKAIVQRLIEERNKSFSPKEAQDVWNQYKRHGIWGPAEDWPTGWSGFGEDWPQGWGRG